MIDIHKTLERISTLKIAVIGDLIEDKYVLGDVTRVSPEAPVPVLNYESHKTCLGGAGNVFMNLHNLGADVHLYCNYDGQPDVEDDILSRIFCNQYPHSVKTRFMSGQHHILRVDREIAYDQIGWPAFSAFSWWTFLQEHFADYDRIVISDYSKGVVSDSLINAIMELTEKYERSGWKTIPVIVDAKRDFQRFEGAYIIKCNRKEADAEPNYICGDIRIITNGGRGIIWHTPEDNGGVDGFSVPIVDVCGAGDTVTAILATAPKDPNLNELCHLANIAASEVCKHAGVYPISKEDLINRFNEVKGYVMQAK